MSCVCGVRCVCVYVVVLHPQICERSRGRGTSPKTGSPCTLLAKAFMLAAMSTVLSSTCKGRKGNCISRSFSWLNLCLHSPPHPRAPHCYCGCCSYYCDWQRRRRHARPAASWQSPLADCEQSWQMDSVRACHVHASVWTTSCPDRVHLLVEGRMRLINIYVLREGSASYPPPRRHHSCCPVAAAAAAGAVGAVAAAAASENAAAVAADRCGRSA